MFCRRGLCGGRNARAALGAGLAVMAVAVVLGLASAASAQVGTQALAIWKSASETDVTPGDVITYTVTFGSSESVTVMMTDTLPFGVTYVEGSASGGAVYDEGRVTWTGTVGGAGIAITFRVTVVEPGTWGPLPILNEACVGDGTEVQCKSVVIYSSHRMYLPLILED